ncbi:MAG: Flp pilus assembly protein CpaB [Gemmatimonadota bacterium]
MKKKRVLFVLLLAITSGLVAGYSVIQYLDQRPTAIIASDSRGSTQPVVVAVRDLGLGQLITEDDLRVIEWPAGSVPTGYASVPGEVVGRGVIEAIRANEPILETKLADSGMGAGLPPLIPEGMRALSVKVDEVIGVAGFVTPQTRVDVILTMTPQGTKDPASKVILQNIQALAAGQEIRKNEEGEPMIVAVVTVLVTLEQAEKLVLAANQGRIQMALRNTLDLETVETDGQFASGLFLGTSRRIRRSSVRTGTPPAAQGFLEMYHGGVRTLVSYQ